MFTDKKAHGAQISQHSKHFTLNLLKRSATEILAETFTALALVTVTVFVRVDVFSKACSHTTPVLGSTEKYGCPCRIL